MPARTFKAVALRDPKTGRVVLGRDGKALVDRYVIDPEKKYLRPYWLNSTPATKLLTAVGTEGDTADIDFVVDQQGHFDWNSIIGNGTGDFAMEFLDVASSRRLQNKPVHSGTMVGSGQRPFYLPEPYFLNVGDSQRVITLRVRNLDPFDNTVRITLYGRRFYHHESPFEIQKKFLAQFGQSERAYSYFLVPEETRFNGDIAPIPIAGSATYRFAADSEADAILQKTMVFSDPVGAEFDFTLRERTTNRLIMTDRVRGFAGWGNSEFPFRLADSYLLERQKDLILEVDNLSGEETRFFFTLACLRVHYDPFI
jgi:hypothetical protein